MHEMSLCVKLLQTLKQQAQAQDFQRVKTVRLVLDPGAGMTAETLRFNFSLAAQGSLAEGAELIIATTFPGHGDHTPGIPGEALRILELEVV